MCLFCLCSTLGLSTGYTDRPSFPSVHEVFSRNHAAPFSKVLTFLRSGPFELEAFYSDPQGVPYPEAKIGKTIKYITLKDLVYKPETYFSNVEWNIILSEGIFNLG